MLKEGDSKTIMDSLPGNRLLALRSLDIDADYDGSEIPEIIIEREKNQKWEILTMPNLLINKTAV